TWTGPISSKEKSGWAHTRLDDLRWTPVTGQDVLFGALWQDIPLLGGEPPLTQMPPLGSVLVGPVPYGVWEDGEALRRALRNTSSGRPMLAAGALHQLRRVFVARGDPEVLGGVSMARVAVEAKPSLAWWAIPARAVAVPAMALADGIWAL